MLISLACSRQISLLQISTELSEYREVEGAQKKQGKKVWLGEAERGWKLKDMKKEAETDSRLSALG